MPMSGVCVPMRMPLFSYFVVMGFTLTLALIYISDRIEPLGSPVPTSQIVGLAKPFKPEPERSPYAITGTNFASAYRPAPVRVIADSKPARRTEPLVQQKPADNTEAHVVPRWNHIAQNPIATLMSIH
jgi:hypothetical protein